jgi:hypothetical protein
MADHPRGDVNGSRGKTFHTVNPLEAMKEYGGVRKLSVTIINNLLYNTAWLGPVRVRDKKNDGSH